MKRAIIIGASSGLGRQVAQLLIQDGWHVGLAARRIERLQELVCISPNRVKIKQIDVNSEDATRKMRELITEVGGMGLFFYAAGIGKQNPALDESIELQTTNTNAMGFVRMVGDAFRYFAERTGGHIVAISSIAGTKGLGPAPSYSATKAMQNTYLQALEQLANQRNLDIYITDIRPGFVHTELLFPQETTATEATANYPMLMTAQKTARLIVQAIEKKRHIVVIDWRWRIVTWLWKHIPNCLWRRLKLTLKGNRTEE